MARFFTPVQARPVDANGNPYPAAKLYFYIAGTTTPQNVYSDSTLVTPLSNPVVADANGKFVQIYLQAATYRVDFKTSADVLIDSSDNVDIGLGLGSGALSILLGGTGASTASGARTNLGLGTAATKDVGTAAGNVPLLGASGEVSATVLAASVNALTEDTSPSITTDFLLEYDTSAAAVKKVKPFSMIVVAPDIILEDQKTAGTAGGSFTAATDTQRNLTTEVRDLRNECSLSSNQFVLTAGTYYIQAQCPASSVNGHQAWLYNVTGAVDLVSGTSGYTLNTTGASTLSTIEGTFTVAAAQTLEIRHRCVTTRATDGLGGVANVGRTEIYTRVKLWRMS